MSLRKLAALGLFTALPLTVVAQGATCNATTLCPARAPCCSEYGYCGKAQFCLGGCVPQNSYQTTSCLPDPLCKSGTYDFNDLSRVLLNATQYNGNASMWDWVVEKGEIIQDPSGDGVRLTLKEEPGGTLISSTRYVHYGQIDFTMAPSKWGGVVTAAITMSDVKDEIDWEWTGHNSTFEAQSNYFYLGHVNYTEKTGGLHPFDASSSDFHTFTLNWQEESLQWIIDGKVVRTLNKADTLSDDGRSYKYPTTPSRVQISIWPAGISTSAPGTVEWAGGMIDWADPDYAANGYFYNTLKSITIQCADELEDTPGTTGYEFQGLDDAGVPVIGFSNRTTMINGARTGAVAPSGLLACAAVAAIALPMAWSIL